LSVRASCRARRDGNDKLDRKVDALFARWSDAADADGQLDFYGLQTLICREMVEAGEVLVRRRLPPRERMACPSVAIAGSWKPTS